MAENVNVTPKEVVTPVVAPKEVVAAALPPVQQVEQVVAQVSPVTSLEIKVADAQVAEFAGVEAKKYNTTKTVIYIVLGIAVIAGAYLYFFFK